MKPSVNLCVNPFAVKGVGSRRGAGRRWSAGLAVAALALAACGNSAGAEGTASTSTATAANATAGSEVVLVTHDSFVVDDAVLADFEKSTGLTVTVLAQGDAGAMVNQLVLTKNNPLGDAVFGIDNSFASRALGEGLLAPYTSAAAPAGSEQYGFGDDRLTPVDYGDVCVNVDHAYFAARGLAEPVTFDDLAKPDYKDMLVVQSPATSSPGLAFLLGTVAHFGQDGWQDYWTKLKDNGVKVTSGWTDSYTVDFSGSSGKGDRPLVVSYASSPPAEITDSTTDSTKKAPTGALLDTCFRQVEYAGVLQGAKNPAGAKEVVDFLLSHEFQAGVAESMYVYPVDASVALPSGWQQFAPAATAPATLDPATIAANREAWIAAWSDLLEG